VARGGAGSVGIGSRPQTAVRIGQLTALGSPMGPSPAASVGCGEDQCRRWRSMYNARVRPRQRDPALCASKGSPAEVPEPNRSHTFRLGTGRLISSVPIRFSARARSPVTLAGPCLGGPDRPAPVSRRSGSAGGWVSSVGPGRYAVRWVSFDPLAASAGRDHLCCRQFRAPRTVRKSGPAGVELVQFSHRLVHCLPLPLTNRLPFAVLTIIRSSSPRRA